MRLASLGFRTKIRQLEIAKHAQNNEILKLRQVAAASRQALKKVKTSYVDMKEKKERAEQLFQRQSSASQKQLSANSNSNSKPPKTPNPQKKLQRDSVVLAIDNALDPRKNGSNSSGFDSDSSDDDSQEAPAWAGEIFADLEKIASGGVPEALLRSSGGGSHSNSKSSSSDGGGGGGDSLSILTSSASFESPLKAKVADQRQVFQRLQSPSTYTGIHKNRKETIRASSPTLDFGGDGTSVSASGSGSGSGSLVKTTAVATNFVEGGKSQRVLDYTNQDVFERLQSNSKSRKTSASNIENSENQSRARSKSRSRSPQRGGATADFKGSMKKLFVLKTTVPEKGEKQDKQVKVVKVDLF